MEEFGGGPVWACDDSQTRLARLLIGAGAHWQDHIEADPLGHCGTFASLVA